MEPKGKRTHGHGQQCGDCRGQGSVRGVNANGKKYNKKKRKQEERSNLSNTRNPQ